MGGRRVWKDDERVEAYGTLDELSSIIGFAISFLGEGDEVSETLLRIQGQLFLLSSELAYVGAGARPGKKIEGRDVEYLDKLVEEYESRLPPLRRFVYPGGTQAASILHIARTVARRAERRVVALSKKHQINPNTIPYINRLSTLLFTLARYLNHRSGVKEREWRG